jgi:PKD repeat protein/proteasome lid subunit RPN8/RPN11
VFYVSISSTAIEKIKEHASKNPDKEVIGLLIGRMEGNTLIIEDTVTGEIVSEKTKAILTPETIAKIADEIVSGKIKGNIIGWYHSHPGFGVFMSEIDIKTQMKMQQFSPYIVALIIDPTKNEIGFFTVEANTRSPIMLTEDLIHIYAPEEEPIPPKFTQPSPPQFFYSPPATTKPPTEKAKPPLRHRKTPYMAITLTAIACLAIVGAYLYTFKYTPLTAKINTNNIGNILHYGDKITLTANVSGGTPPYNCTWYINGKMNKTENQKIYSNFEYIAKDLGNVTIKFVVTDGTKKSFSKNISFIIQPNAFIWITQPKKDRCPAGKLTIEGVLLGIQDDKIIGLNYSVTITLLNARGEQLHFNMVTTSAGFFSDEWDSTHLNPENVTLHVKFDGSERHSPCEIYRKFTIITPPKANFTYEPSLPSVNEDVTFDASNSSDLDGKIVRYEWDFDNDNIFEKNGMVVQYRFNYHGDFIVKLKVTDNDNLTNLISKQIKVNAKPIAKISASPIEGYTPLNVTFNASESYDPDGGNLKYYWDFGDGERGTDKIINHTYSLPSGKLTITYNVTLRVVDDEKTENITTTKITVLREYGFANFTWEPKYPYACETVTFNAQNSKPSTGAIITKYYWTFEDKPIEKWDPIVTYVFYQTGNYTVSLRIEDSAGFTYEITNTVKVIEKTKADFTVNGNLVVNETLTFKFNGTGWIKEYLWNFSDGKTVITRMPTVTHYFSIPGDYSVILQVTDYNGKSDSIKRVISISSNENSQG